VRAERREDRRARTEIRGEEKRGQETTGEEKKRERLNFNP